MIEWKVSTSMSWVGDSDVFRCAVWTHQSGESHSVQIPLPWAVVWILQVSLLFCWLSHRRARLQRWYTDTGSQVWPLSAPCLPAGQAARKVKLPVKQVWGIWTPEGLSYSREATWTKHKKTEGEEEGVERGSREKVGRRGKKKKENIFWGDGDKGPHSCILE